MCLHPGYIYEILALFQVHSIAVSNPCPNTRLTSSSGGNAYVCLVCPLPVRPIMNPSWVTLLCLILPPGAPQKHAPPPHSPFVCVLVCSQGPIETAVPCVEGSLFEASEGSARYCAARWHYGKVSIAGHLKISGSSCNSGAATAFVAFTVLCQDYLVLLTMVHVIWQHGKAEFWSWCPATQMAEDASGM